MSALQKKATIFLFAFSFAVLAGVSLLLGGAWQAKILMIAFALLALGSLWGGEVLCRRMTTGQTQRKLRLTQVASLCLCALFCAAAASGAYALVFLRILGKEATFSAVYGASFFVRTVLFFLLCLLLCSYLRYAPKTVHQMLFRYRWYVALGVFLVLFACKITLSNVSSFHFFIQRDAMTEFTLPVLGFPRTIRSDEWLVNLPRILTSEYTGFAEWNDICRAAENTNAAVSGLHLSVSALANPFHLGYYLFGTAWGSSFYWCALAIVTFMVNFEFFLLLTHRRPLLSLFGTALVAFSPFQLWWSLSAYLLAIPAILVCSYYFLHTDRYGYRILFALGVGMSASYFICALYPAWQVPIAYLLIALFLFVVVDGFDRIQKMRWKDWALVCGAVAVLLLIVLSYLVDLRSYSEAVMQTVYPGQRFETGGYALQKPSLFLQSLLYPFKNTGNNSEAGVFFSLFPLPMLFATYLLLRQMAEKRAAKGADTKEKPEPMDGVLIALLAVAVFFTVYCTVGFPHWLSKITLMSYAPASRVADMLGWTNVLLLVRVMTHERHFLSKSAGAVIGIAVVCNSLIASMLAYPTYLPLWYAIPISLVTLALVMACICRLSSRLRTQILTVVTVLTMVSGLCVLPLTRGLDAVLEKPASHQVQAIVALDPEAKWIGANNFVAGQFLIANGARCYTSVNYIPNMEWYQTLDPQGKYSDIYNRYAHIQLTLTEGETTFSLMQADLIDLRLSYRDLDKAGAKYYLSMGELEFDPNQVNFRLLYAEENIFIYQYISSAS